MGIDSNDFSPAGGADTVSDAQRADNQQRHTQFSGTEFNNSAPEGSLDFLGLSSRIGISRIDSTVEPYLEKTLKLVKDNLPNVSLVRLDRVSNSYALQFEGPDGTVNFFGLQFVSTGDPISPNLYPASAKVRLMRTELKERFPEKRIRLSDARVILAGYEPDMSKFYEMADTIVRTFQMTSVPELKNAQIMSLTTNEFVADWSLSEAKREEALLSPHGIRPRMEVGLTIKAKIRNEMGREFREFDTDYRTLGVIGGYTEIREKEEFVVNNQRVLLYRPVFNITVLNAMIPLEGVAAILLAAFAPTIYSTQFWAKQWSDLSEGQPNPGMLEENPDHRGRPFILKDNEELLDFIRTYFAAPVIVLQIQDGTDAIPGMRRLTSTNLDDKAHFMNRLSNFFGSPEENVQQIELSRVIETRFDGAYGDPKGILHDSRDIDYLYVAAKNGMGAIDTNMRRTLLGNAENSSERARVIQSVTNSFIPLYLDQLALINPDLIKWIIQKTDSRRMVIVDPNSRTESRSLGSFLDGFGQATNLGSIVTSGVTNRGLNLGSVWSN